MAGQGVCGIVFILGSCTVGFCRGSGDGGVKNGIGGEKFMGPVARAKFVVVVLMMLIE